MEDEQHDPYQKQHEQHCITEAKRDGDDEQDHGDDYVLDDGEEGEVDGVGHDLAALRHDQAELDEYHEEFAKWEEDEVGQQGLDVGGVAVFDQQEDHEEEGEEIEQETKDADAAEDPGKVLLVETVIDLPEHVLPLLELDHRLP